MHAYASSQVKRQSFYRKRELQMFFVHSFFVKLEQRT